MNPPLFLSQKFFSDFFSFFEKVCSFQNSTGFVQTVSTDDSHLFHSKNSKNLEISFIILSPVLPPPWEWLHQCEQPVHEDFCLTEKPAPQVLLLAPSSTFSTRIFVFPFFLGLPTIPVTFSMISSPRHSTVSMLKSSLDQKN